MNEIINVQRIANSSVQLTVGKRVYPNPVAQFFCFPAGQIDADETVNVKSVELTPRRAERLPADVQVIFGINDTLVESFWCHGHLHQGVGYRSTASIRVVPQIEKVIIDRFIRVIGNEASRFLIDSSDTPEDCGHCEPQRDLPPAASRVACMSTRQLRTGNNQFACRESLENTECVHFSDLAVRIL